MSAPFELYTPRTVDEAIVLLAQLGDEGHLMAGGVSLVLLMEQGLVRPEHVVSLHRIAALKTIAHNAEGWLEIGALATHADIAGSPLVQAHAPMLAEAFGRVGTVRIRNQGTIGGNLAHADPAQDPPPALIAHAAEVLVLGPLGPRAIPVEELATDVFTTSLTTGELIVGVRVPPLPAGHRARYLKFLPRTEDDYATVSVAVAAAPGPGGVLAHVRIALGAVGATPIRARSAEDALRDRRPDEKLVEWAAALAAEATDPFDDVRGSAAYKRDMARVFTARALRSVAGLGA